MEFIRSRKSSLSLDMAPLIDIVFQLLIFFMLSSSFLNPSLRLNLPKAVSGNAKDQERIVISVDKAGSIFLNTTKVDLGALEEKLKPMMQAYPQKSVHIRGDEEMPYRLFVEVMDAARQSGAKQINIVHSAKNNL